MQELTDSVRKARTEVQALVTEIESKRSVHLKGIAP
jgi:chromosome partitioning protein